MGRAVASVDLPCDWAQFLYTFAERGLEDSAIIIIATWYRGRPAMTQQFYMKHGHPDGDLMTSLLAYQWFEETRKHFQNQYADRRVAWNREWFACAKVGLMLHVMHAISGSVQVLSKAFEDHKHAFPQVPKRDFAMRKAEPLHKPHPLSFLKAEWECMINMLFWCRICSLERTTSALDTQGLRRRSVMWHAHDVYSRLGEPLWCGATVHGSIEVQRSKNVSTN